MIERNDPTNSTSLQAKWVNSKIRVALVSDVLQVFDQPSTVPDHLGNMGWNNNMALPKKLACAASEVRQVIYH